MVMTARSIISSHRNCRRFLAAMHHAAILNNYSDDLQVLHFTVERGVQFWSVFSRKYQSVKGGLFT